MNSKNFILLLFAFTIVSCKELIDVDVPDNQLVSAAVFEDDLTATAAISAVYSRMINEQVIASGGFASATFLVGLTSDELMLHMQSGPEKQFNDNNISSTNNILPGFWNESYNHIYQANAIIEGLEKSINVTPRIKKQIIGEAHFLRAFAHFYLVNLFGDVPYITVTNYERNSTVSRTPKKEVMNQIVADLEIARDRLSEGYEFSNTERVRVNKYAAIAMLARVNLYMKNWSAAEQNATTLIEKSDLYALSSDLNSVFLKNSMEAIWQLMPTNRAYTNEGELFLSGTTIGFSSIRDSFLQTFEDSDNRRVAWVTVVNIEGDTRSVPYKYQDYSESTARGEYSMVLRLAEQYLIRAEARAELGKLLGNDGAEGDLNTIRLRAGLGATTASTKEQMIDAVMQERQVEFFVEWGHRWFDLKRRGRLNAILEDLKPQWNAYDTLFPIPFDETITNTKIGQNYGF